MAHIPVLIKEVLENLDPKPNQNFIDATVGDGGHASAILEKINPKGKLIAIDRDPESIARAKSNLSKFGDRVVFVNDSFGNILEIIKSSKISETSGILFDFGMSSSQLQNSGRGFSFQKNEILDMRYDAKSQITAEDIVNEYSEKELAEIFKKWGEESRASKIAAEIIKAREKTRIKTTDELVKIIEKVARRRGLPAGRQGLPAGHACRQAGRQGKLHPATLIFQALRIEVNGELSEIEKALKVIPEILNKNGRAAFISFHSLEDRLIKNWSRDLSKNGIIKILNKKPVTASDEELKINSRSRSAKLRAVEKI